MPTAPSGHDGGVGLGDVNRTPRRWVDRSARVRVVEGWHPSRPDDLGYNLLVDGEWIGTFDTLDDAAVVAAGHVRRPGVHAAERKVALLPSLNH